MKVENNYFKVAITDHHFELIQKVGGSLIIPIAKETNDLIMLKIHRQDGLVHYEFPRGFAKSNEGPMDTAIRELKEETNLEVDIVRQLGCVMPDSGISDRKIKIYVGLVAMNDNHIKLQASEHILGVQFFSEDKVKQLIKSGKIIDGYSLSAFALLESGQEL